MPNVNQVKFGDTMIMDISDTTASPEDVNEGEIFYTANGARSVGTGGYTLPIASENRLGGIKVGRNLSIDNNSGVLDAINTEYSEGDGIEIEDNTISLDIDYLTASRLGVIPSSEKGTNNGVATLNENGKIPNSQLPEIDAVEALNISQSAYDALPDVDKNDPSKLYFVGENNNSVVVKNWNGFTNIKGSRVWTDGTNIYYSGGSNQYKLNGDTWESMTWGNFSNIFGDSVWTDGTYYYYSGGSNQYRLNGTTWEEITWTGLTNFSGNDIWTDGNNIYFSNDFFLQYKLNGTTWESMVWNGYTNFSGEYVWTDGIGVYYSNNANQYKINDFYSADGIYYKNINYVKPSYSAGNGIDIEETTISLDIDYLTASRLGVISSDEKGVNNGVATLNENGKMPNSQMPMANENNLGGIKVGDGLSIDNNGVLSVTGGGGGGNSVTVENKGSASASTIAYQAITIDNIDYKIDGTVYMEQTLQVTANTDATFTFANSIITTDSAIDLWASIYGVAPKSVIVTSGSCVVIFNIPTTTDLTCRIYIRNNASAPIIETYLPYSTNSNIVCEAYVGNFDSSSNVWGKGARKVQFSGTPTLNTSEEAVSLLANTNSTIGYVDLDSSATPFTVYVLMKAVNPTSSSV